MTTTAEQTITEVPGPPPPGRGWWLTARALAVAAVLAFGTLVATGAHWYAGHSADSGRAGARAAAEEITTYLTSIDHNQAIPDVARVLDHSTGEFGDMFAQNRDSYVGVLRAGQVVAKGTVVASGVKQFTGDTAEVLVAVRANVRNKDLPRGEDRMYRMVERLIHRDGRWLLARVEFIP